MSSNKASWVQNGAHPECIDPVRTPSLQQHDGRKSLLERLKSDKPHGQGRRSDAVAKEPQYVDVTAAFFARRGHQAHQAKHQAPLHHEVLRHGPPFSWKEQEQQQQQQQQQKLRSPPQEPRTPDSPLSGELKKNIATEADLICSSGSAKLNDVYEALKAAMVDAGTENDRVLAMIESHHTGFAKSLSETMCDDTLTNEHAKSTSRSKCRLSSVVDSVREQIQTLEAEVGQLWDDWEVAELEVQDILASVIGEREDGLNGQTSLIKEVQESLTLELESFDQELLNVTEEAHEAAKVSEKDFGKKINGVMNALLQRYLLED